METITTALAYDSRNANRRPVFTMRQSTQKNPAGGFRAVREWTGARSSVIAREEISWDNGLQEVSTHIESLEESCDATVSLKASAIQIESKLISHMTQGRARQRSMRVPHQPVTLSSLPFLIAQHWQALMQGDVVYASYLLLKVQRAATVKIQRKSGQHALNAIRIEVVPTNLLLRLIFGATVLHFENDSAKLVKVVGLLDPRDRKPGGRWREYLGTLEYDEPWDLNALAPAQGVQA